MADSGNLLYLTIEGFKDNGFNDSVGDYVAMINPDKMTEKFKVEYNDEQSPGSPNTVIKYRKSLPSDLDFELVFDGTGVVNPKRTQLMSEIGKFKRIVYDYNGAIHSPNYLKLTWGKALKYQCRLTSLSINYTLFKPDGTPLRAKANVGFRNYIAPAKLEAEKDNQSPDLTHEVVVKAGDTLPL
ncbi:MAG: LysM peptidoglycan-binding domain-containing protein, partial [Cyclobacteriaceae bacterium]